MSKSSQSNKKQQIANLSLTNPAFATPTIYFSTLVKNIEQYKQIINQKQPLLNQAIQILKHEQKIPKYFDILTNSSIIDLDWLNTYFYFKHENHQLQLLAHDDIIAHQEDDTIKLTYAQMYDMNIKAQSTLLEQLSQLKQKNITPELIPFSNTPYMQDNQIHFPEAAGVDKFF